MKYFCYECVHCNADVFAKSKCTKDVEDIDAAPEISPYNIACSSIKLKGE